MSERVDGANVVSMTDEDQRPPRARAIELRRVRLGIKSQTEAAEQSRAQGMYVSRDTIMAAEKGAASDSSYQRLEAFYDAFEEETGHDDVEPDGSTVTVTVAGDFGVEITIKGPVANMPDFEASAARLIREMRKGAEE